MSEKLRKSRKRSFFRAQMTKPRPDPSVTWESHHVTDITVTASHFLTHIAPATAKRLVQEGVVTRIEIDPMSEPAFCELCVHAKTKRVPIARACEGERAATFGNEIHSD